MSPLLRKLTDVLIAVALTAAVVFVIVVANHFLMARGSSLMGFKMWLGFIGRPDILGTMVLTALVSAAYSLWQQGGRPRL